MTNTDFTGPAKYFRQLPKNPDEPLDPTMRYCVDVRKDVAELLNNLKCKFNITWIDRYTCLIVLEEGYRWI